MKKLFIFLFIVSCSSAPKHEALNYFSDSHPSCKIKASDLNLSVIKATEKNLFRGIKSTSSLMFTTVGYATDVMVVGGGILGLSWLCGQSSSANCMDFILSTDYDWDYQGLGKWTYNKTSPWRCPYVDHISQAVRDSARCNFQQGHYIETYEQLLFLEENKVMKECLSNQETKKVIELRNSLSR